MIKLIRVDHRLLHGQVIFSWTRQMAINHIIVADDKVPGDPIGKMALSIAKPAGCTLDIIPFSQLSKSVETHQNQNIMIIVKGPEEAKTLCQILPEVKKINYGGVAKKPGSKEYGKAVYLNENELKATREILEKGVEIYIQQVPTASVEHADFSK
ncbi:MAG TPA: PTS sugar transporter subunit IIB [Candidatus Cottocaccamicrobium excrementipullorum]|nr:PTS sugar transporter subunit IIB [Candidatus Cottocaccamicrobium excrementipullorum]